MEQTRPLQIKAPRGEKLQGKEMFILSIQLNCLHYLNIYLKLETSSITKVVIGVISYLK